jgi:predicted dehydrogenase
VQATALEDSRSASDDIMTITLRFADGSFAAIHYLANGHRGFPKERIEVFGGGKIVQLDNFRRLRAYGVAGLRTMNLWRQDKGHAAATRAFLDAVRQGQPSPIPVDESIEVTRASFDAIAAARTGATIRYGEATTPNTPVPSRAA